MQQPSIIRPPTTTFLRVKDSQPVAAAAAAATDRPSDGAL